MRKLTTAGHGIGWGALAAGSSVTTNFCITTAVMDAFCALSGDANPLHRDLEYARSYGFDGPVVYGALLVARISELIGMHLSGAGVIWAGLKIDFRNPLYVNEQAQLRAVVNHRSEAARTITLELRIETEDRCIATGSAETVFIAND